MLQNDNLTTNAQIETTESLVDISTNETDNGKSPSSMPSLEQNGSTRSTHLDEHNNELHVNASTPLLSKDENQQAPDALKDMLKRNLATAVVATLVNISCTNKSMKSWFACTLSLQSNVEAAAI
ncbi:hypothetical protein [Anaerobiospirillum succiniciproducens]|uniref:hypothetical protein n=1 Tax=Anaerobiospirillum succiniciproducens TaxID=13335 RepID=UPI002357BB22|nr:hypothetical protein [Anaerobiospirillum succiniciproducens]MCI6863713.1 hypothetical protein [Anaerobiospirillum succiniciproducens]